MEEEKLKDNNFSKVKILKCNKCNTIPYFKFYMKYDKELKIFLKCKCNQINTNDFNILKEYLISIDKMPKKENKFKSNYLTDDVYKQILNGYKLAKEKIYVKLKEIRDEELKILYDRIERIENIYEETFKQNVKILNIIQILIDTYENYTAENYKTFEILSQNIMNNTNFNLEIKNIFSHNFNSEEKIIYINSFKYNLQHLKTISLPKLDYKNYDIKLNLLSNKKILAFCKKQNENCENTIIYMTLNDDYTIKSEKIINNYFDYSKYFEIDKDKLFFYKNYFDCISHILNIRTFEISKFYLNYDSFFNYLNGNIIGFSTNKIGIINLKGEILLSKETEEKEFRFGLLLPNNNLIFANRYTIFLLDEKLNEIKRKELSYISDVLNFDKRILVNDSRISILNLNLEIECTIYYNELFGTIYGIYTNINNSTYENDCIYIDNKKNMAFKFGFPYLFPPYTNKKKIIFGRLRNQKNRGKYFQLLYENKKILILYSNNLLIYQSPN